VASFSSAARFLDEVVEPGLVSSGDFAHEVPGELQIPLRAGQCPRYMARRGDFAAKVNVLFTPQ
jgi:hypothetical protein